MRKINTRNIALIMAVTALDIGVGTYERLVPSRGILYWFQTHLLSGYGAVQPGTTAVNMTNTMSYVGMNTMASFNVISSTILLVLILIVALAFAGLLGMRGGMHG